MRPRRSTRGVPGFGFRLERSRIPLAPSLSGFSRPISSLAQIMPSLSSPRIFAFSRVTGSPSPCHFTLQPGAAYAMYIPSLRLSPPHTRQASGFSDPVEIFARHSLSAFGCGFNSLTWPTTTPSRRSLPLLTPSTSAVFRVRSSANFSGVMPFGI